MSISDVIRYILKGKRDNASSRSSVQSTQEPGPNDIPLGDGWEFEESIPLRRLAALYTEHGWMWAHTNGVPAPYEIAEFIAHHTERIDADENGMYSTYGRLLFLKDEEFPGCVDVYLHVGTASREDDEEVTVEHV